MENHLLYENRVVLYGKNVFLCILYGKLSKHAFPRELWRMAKKRHFLKVREGRYVHRRCR